jgi:hypothetical protein
MARVQAYLISTGTGERMDGKEFTGEALKTTVGLLMAAAIGWLYAMWKKPSRDDIAKIEARMTLLETDHRTHSQSFGEFRTEIKALLDGMRDTLRQLRGDIRDLRGERTRETDP